MNKITITKGRMTIVRDADGTYHMELDGQNMMIFGEDVARDMRFCLNVCCEVSGK